MLYPWRPSLLRSVVITVVSIATLYGVLMGALWLTILVNR
jgi:hypothetical protein